MLNLANIKPLDCVVHLGAGECSELGTYIEQMPKRVILVDANQHCCHDLQQKCALHPNVEILHAVISDKTEEAEFNLCNVVGLSSLRKPSGVLKLYPRFKIVQTYPVQTLAIDELIEQLAIDKAGNNLLVIDTPGEEYALIMKLQESGRLNLFKYFMINAGVDELYLNARTSTEIVELFKHNDFNLIREDISHDVDRPCLVFGVDQLKVDFIKLQLESAELNQKLSYTQEQIVVKQQEFEQTKLELSKSLEAKQAELLQSQVANKQITSESQAQLSKLTAELQAKVAEQIKLTAQKEQQLAEMNQKLAQIQTQTSVKQQEFEQAKLELSKSLEAKQAELLQSQVANKQITSESQAQLSKLTAELQAKEAELNKIRQDYDALKEKSVSVLAEKLTELKVEQDKVEHLEQKTSIFSAKISNLEQLSEQQMTEINELNQLSQAQLQLNESVQSEFDLLQINYNQQSEDFLLLRDELISTDQRQRLLEDECTKAEAQIDLIKEFALPLALSHR